jgi:hypothetical protein
MNPEAELRTGARHHGVDGRVDRQDVHPGDRDRGPGYAALAGPPSRRGDAGHDLGQLPGDSRVAVRRAGPLLPTQAGDDNVAVLVVERGEGVEGTISASGAAPPNCPLCFGPARFAPAR